MHCSFRFSKHLFNSVSWKTFSNSFCNYVIKLIKNILAHYFFKISNLLNLKILAHSEKKFSRMSAFDPLVTSLLNFDMWFLNMFFWKTHIFTMRHKPTFYAIFWVSYDFFPVFWHFNTQCNAHFSPNQKPGKQLDFSRSPVLDKN